VRQGTDHATFSEQSEWLNPIIGAFLDRTRSTASATADNAAHREIALRFSTDLVPARCESVFLAEGAAVLSPSLGEGFVAGNDVKEFLVDRLLPHSMKGAVQIL
jgi:hypothetical protein